MCGIVSQWVMVMEKIFEQVLLYDFYGELLTEHQRSIYEDAVYNDMSLGEIAEVHGISRQGVHDLLRRCDRILLDYESKLHLVERFAAAKEKIREIVDIAGEIGAMYEADSDPAGCGERDRTAGQSLRRIQDLAAELINEI